ncbi:hypothetical protein MJM95_29380, partial [Salmonella enterica subsp. enterica serovar Anatum]|nr:hypothetical protein [Salmonella enterica subsp. enterica serovar Anatum]
ISGLLDIYQPLLSLSLNDFRELVEKERLKRFPIESRLFQKLSEKERLKRFPIESRLFQKLSTRHRLAYVEVVSKLPTDSAEYPV